MSDKPYKFDESPEQVSQSTLRSELIYGNADEEAQRNTATGYGASPRAILVSRGPTSGPYWTACSRV